MKLHKCGNCRMCRWVMTAWQIYRGIKRRMCHNCVKTVLHLHGFRACTAYAITYFFFSLKISLKPTRVYFFYLSVHLYISFWPDFTMAFLIEQIENDTCASGIAVFDCTVAMLAVLLHLPGIVEICPFQLWRSPQYSDCGDSLRPSRVYLQK